MVECLAEDAIVDLLEGRLGGAALDEITAHLDTCAPCRELVASAARGLPGGSGEPRAGSSPLARGTSIGRYVILGPAGAGSMGMVYAAYDPELDRRIALKLLRADAFAARPAPELRARLLREAQALARLSHPNVIAVFDVGTFQGEVFVAMEYVEGGTLGAHLHAKPRSIAGVIELFRQAGEGLVAAHEAGVIHRDFKPENVFVGKDGRARVGDFGLAHTSGSGTAALTDAALASLPVAAMTRTGALVGTPAYMAPEQWSGKSVDARTDVFAFSVALYEALHGERPFAGDSLGELSASIERGEVRPPKKSVPARLRRALLRGMRADPEQRHPTMRALLDELKPPPRRRAAAIALTSVLALGALAFGTMKISEAPPVCADAAQAWGDAYDAKAQTEIERAFGATGDPSATFAAASIARSLAAYRDAWTAMRTDACEATRVRGTQSEALLDARMACLSNRRHEVSGLVDALRRADAKTVASAISAAASLTPVSECARATTLLAPEPPPSDPARRAEHDALSAELSRAKALADLRRFDECQAVVRPLAPRVETLGYKPLEARSLFLTGLCEKGTGDLPVTEATLQRAVTIALAARQDDVAADAWLLLIEVAGQRNHAEEGHLWDRYAAAAIARIGGDEEREALREARIGGLELFQEHQIDSPRAHLERARSLFVKTRGEHHWRVAQVDELSADVLFDERRFEEALALHRRVYALRAETLGPDHVSLATSLANVGVCLDNLERPDEALAVFEEILRRWPQRDTMYLRARMARALRTKKSWAAALESDRLALARGETQHPRPTAMDRVPPLTGVGLDLLGLGRASEAIAPLEEAAAAGEGDGDMGETHFALGRALWDGGGDRARALAFVERARVQAARDAGRFGPRAARDLAEIERWIAAHKT